jgi:hypothetical protein
VQKLKSHLTNKRQQLHLQNILQDSAMSKMFKKIKNDKKDLFVRIIKESKDGGQSNDLEFKEQLWHKHIYDSDVRVFCIQGVNIEDKFRARIADNNDNLAKTINDSEYNRIAIETDDSQDSLTAMVIFSKRYIDFDEMFLHELTHHNKDFFRISGKSMTKDLFYTRTDCGKEHNKEYSSGKPTNIPINGNGKFIISIENTDSDIYLTDKCPINFFDEKGKLIAVVNIR